MKADKELKAAGMACINLTPEIKKALNEMQGKQVLEVFSDDPAARFGVPSWCRLTGHALIETNEISSTDTLFFIQKKSS